MFRQPGYFVLFVLLGCIAQCFILDLSEESQVAYQNCYPIIRPDVEVIFECDIINISANFEIADWPTPSIDNCYITENGYSNQTFADNGM